MECSDQHRHVDRRVAQLVSKVLRTRAERLLGAFNHVHRHHPGNSRTLQDGSDQEKNVRTLTDEKSPDKNSTETTGSPREHSLSFKIFHDFVHAVQHIVRTIGKLINRCTARDSRQHQASVDFSLNAGHNIGIHPVADNDRILALHI